jgi:tetratricopeptide (TPR) repeat protein
MRQKRYAEAIVEFEAATKLTLNASVRLQLGDAYIHSGEKQKGIAEIQDAVAKDGSPTTLNDAAYTLAENNLQLDDALRYAKKAVGDVEDGTIDITLDELSPKDIQTVPILAAYWDTLGWVYFRLGHLDQAEKFLRAGWSLTQDPVVADHLRQVYAKQGKAREVPRDTQALQNLRTVKLGKLATKHVSAEFYLLFAPGPRVVETQFISGSEELRDAGKALEAAKFDVPFPEDGDSQIVRRGILDCEPVLPGCVFVLIPPNSLHSVH